MRVRSPSATLTLTTTVSPGWKSGIFAPGNLAACSASSFSMMFISDSCRDAGFLRAGERFGALFSVEARLIEQRPARVERYCRGRSLTDHAPIIELIAATSIKTGLKVESALDTSHPKTEEDRKQNS